MKCPNCGQPNAQFFFGMIFGGLACAIALLVICLLSGGRCAHAERPHIFTRKHVAIVLVGLARAADWQSTTQCERYRYAQCHEALLPDKLARSKAGLAAYEIGATFVSWRASEWLEHRRRKRMAEAVLWADFADMASLQVNNQKLFRGIR